MATRKSSSPTSSKSKTKTSPEQAMSMKGSSPAGSMSAPSAKRNAAAAPIKGRVKDATAVGRLKGNR